MSLFKGIVSALGYGGGEEYLRETLKSAAIPITAPEVKCRSCANPCEDGHDEYPPRFFIDHSSQLLGSVKPYSRQVLISTGKSDWDSKIEHTSGTLAYNLTRVRETVYTKPKTQTHRPRCAGVFDSTDFSKLSILNGSHKSISEEDDTDTVLVFPDYILVSHVPRSAEGARWFYDACLDPNVSREDKDDSEGRPFRSWVLPYGSVGSHKRRDNRCGIAAAKLEIAFTQSLESNGWSVETELEYPLDQPLEEYTEEQRKKQITESLEKAVTERRALLLKNSHSGGHKFAGNCIIYTPRGSGIWYGRVTTHETEAIVVNTIEQGKILPSILRGGINLTDSEL